MSGGYRKLKLELMAKDKHCHWCKIEVHDHVQIEGVRQPDDTATIDHLISRFFRKKGETVAKVLACQKCNLQRARDEEKLNQVEHLKKLRQKNKELGTCKMTRRWKKYKHVFAPNLAELQKQQHNNVHEMPSLSQTHQNDSGGGLCSRSLLPQ